mgnify:CR=1 FL=1|tara:strand:- start:419 stop:877 length:459 start_codon:yes stop_codon:yes gene_type:complete
MIDKNNLFNLFDNDNGDKTKEAKEVFLSNPNFLEEPYTKIGMFTKLISNHHVFHDKLAKFLKREKSQVNIEDTKRASEFTVFNRAWYYLNQIDMKNQSHLEALMDFKTEPFLSSIDDAIRYFSDPDVEQYERCAKLLEIKTFKEEIENPVPF